MALVTFRVPPDLAERFAAIARGQGGKSAVLRRLVVQATEAAGVPPQPTGAAEPAAVASATSRSEGRAGPPEAGLPAVTAALGPSQKVTVRLSAAEMARVAEVAKLRGMNRTQWITSLVRARLGLDLPQTGDERVALRAIARELNRIGGNINQIARAANTEVARSGGPALVDAAAIAEAREAIETVSSELRFVLARSAGYWDAPGP